MWKLLCKAFSLATWRGKGVVSSVSAARSFKRLSSRWVGGSNSGYARRSRVNHGFWLTLGNSVRIRLWKTLPKGLLLKDTSWKTTFVSLISALSCLFECLVWCFLSFSFLIWSRFSPSEPLEDAEPLMDYSTIFRWEPLMMLPSWTTDIFSHVEPMKDLPLIIFTGYLKNLWECCKDIEPICLQCSYSWVELWKIWIDL